MKEGKYLRNRELKGKGIKKKGAPAPGFTPVPSALSGAMTLALEKKKEALVGSQTEPIHAEPLSSAPEAGKSAPPAVQSTVDELLVPTSPFRSEPVLRSLQPLRQTRMDQQINIVPGNARVSPLTHADLKRIEPLAAVHADPALAPGESDAREVVGSSGAPAAFDSASTEARALSERIKEGEIAQEEALRGLDEGESIYFDADKNRYTIGNPREDSYIFRSLDKVISPKMPHNRENVRNFIIEHGLGLDPRAAKAIAVFNKQGKKVSTPENQYEGSLDEPLEKATSENTNSFPLPTEIGPEHALIYEINGKQEKVELLKEFASDGERLFRYKEDGAPMREGYLQVVLEKLGARVQRGSTDGMAAGELQAPDTDQDPASDAVGEPNKKQVQVIELLSRTERPEVAKAIFEAMEDIAQSIAKKSEEFLRDHELVIDLEGESLEGYHEDLAASIKAELELFFEESSLLDAVSRGEVIEAYLVSFGGGAQQENIDSSSSELSAQSEEEGVAEKEKVSAAYEEYSRIVAILGVPPGRKDVVIKWFGAKLEKDSSGSSESTEEVVNWRLGVQLIDSTTEGSKFDAALERLEPEVPGIQEKYDSIMRKYSVTAKKKELLKELGEIGRRVAESMKNKQ